MKKIVLYLSLAIATLSGCVQEQVVPYNPITDADVFYEYYSDAYGTIIEGEIINDGETYIDAVQLEVRMYDRYGYVIDYDYLWVDAFFYPGEAVDFYFDLPERYVHTVEVFIHEFD